MSIQYLELADFVDIAAEVTGLAAPVVRRITNLDLADSALHAPQAGFGGEDLYPELPTKAAVLLQRLVKNHPLPDGNKRAAWVSMRYFLMLNHWEWSSAPEVNDAERAVLNAASDVWDHSMLAAWLTEYVRPTGT